MIQMFSHAFTRVAYFVSYSAVKFSGAKSLTEEEIKKMKESMIKVSTDTLATTNTTSQSIYTK